MEIRGASIHSSTDNERKTPSRGYSFAGRLWNGEYINKLAVLVESNISIVTSGEGKTLKDISDPEKGIVAFSRVLKGWDVRGADIACRYGGEEFTLILPETSQEDTRLKAEQLREEIKHLNAQHNGQSLNEVTLSLGVAVFPDHGSTTEAVLRAADLALYRAKQEGRNRVVVCQALEEETTHIAAAIGLNR
jgi:predicted signal transduction protein with EAL and GGDEF domain